MKATLKRYLGDRTFYKMVIALVIPLIIQQGITSFVSLLDNVMVGGLGTEAISSVAIVNQLVMVFNLALFGGLSGASIFGAQFFGNGDFKGLRETFRFKLIFGFVACVCAIGVFLLFGSNLVSLFLSGDNDAALRQTLEMAQDYMRISLWGLVPFMIVQTYTGTLRETGETVAPMVSSILAILVNLVLNYALIYGNFGFPRLGVAGAAIATVISRYVEMTYLVVSTHLHTERYSCFSGIYSDFSISAALAKKIVRTGTPLMVNELLWSLGMTVINQNYSTRGLNAVAAVNIESTAWNFFCIIMFAMGNAVAILVGQRLGAGDVEGAKEMDRKLVTLTVLSNVVIGGLLMLASPYIPLIYNIEPEVRQLTSQLLLIAGASLPIGSFVHATYFTIRSGGKTVVTFFFDCVYTWCVPVTLAFTLCRFTDFPLVLIFFCVQFIDIIKAVIGAVMLKNGFWAKNIIDGTKLENAEA